MAHVDMPHAPREAHALPSPRRTSRAPVVGICSRKGGSGKTTTSLNLAGALREGGWRPLLVDLDPQASLTRLLLDVAAPGIGERLVNPQRGLAGLALDVAGGIALYPGDRGIESAAFQFVDNPKGPFLLRTLLAERAEPDCDIVLLDTPPTLSFATTSALLAADLALMPTLMPQQDIDALEDTLALRADLEDLGAARRTLIVPNNIRVDSYDRATLAGLRAHDGILVSAPIPQAVAVKKALAQRRPVVDTDPRGAAAEAYRALARRVIGEVTDGEQG
jgi:chromosome partitioning protein